MTTFCHSQPMKIFYDGYIIKNKFNPEYVQDYFYLSDDDAELFEMFDSVKLGSVIGKELDEYEMLVWEEGDDLPYMEYRAVFVDRMGEPSPITVQKGVDTYPLNEHSQAFKVFFDDDNATLDTLPVQHDDKPKEKPVKKLKPLKRKSSEGLMLVYEICNHYSIKCLSDMSAVKAWSNIISKKVTSEYIETIAENKESITLISGDKLNKSDFLEKYRKRFE